MMTERLLQVVGIRPASLGSTDILIFSGNHGPRRTDRTGSGEGLTESQEGMKYVFHCASGWRSALTVATLQDMGFEAAHLKEGFSTWEKQGGAVEQHDPSSKKS